MSLLSADEFVAHIQAVMKRSLDYLPGLSFSKLSCTIFPEDQMQHPMAHIFGCEPDYDAWTNKTNPSPKPEHPFMRSAGGHIHVETKLNKREVIKCMDLCLAVPSVLMDVDGDKRRSMYGQPGAHRPKPYGVEYRTLSNFWIFDEKTIRWAWRNTERALALVKDKFPVDEHADAIIEAVKNNNKKLANDLVNYFELEVV